MNIDQNEDINWIDDIFLEDEGSKKRNVKIGRPIGALGKHPRTKRRAPRPADKQTKIRRRLIREKLKSYQKKMIEDLKTDLHFTEEYLYELIRTYKHDRSMNNLIVGLAHIVKARKKTRYL